MHSVSCTIAAAQVTDDRPDKQAKPDPGAVPGTVVDLSGEDITGLDDAAVASLLEEALAEAEVTEKRKPAAPEPEPAALEGSAPETTEEVDLEMDEPSEDGGREGLDLDALGLTELAGGGAMLSDEDADLAFPDDLYEDSGKIEDPNEAIIDTLREEAEILREEADSLRTRVEELTRSEREAMFERMRFKDENSTLASQIVVYRDRLLGIQDSLDVHRERMAKERDKGIRREKEKVLRAMLPVVDHMELALHHAQNGASGSALVEGFALILEQFRKALTEQGVTSVVAQRGMPFDPTLHDAVMREETDEVPPSCITQVLRTGYTLGDHLLRAARVAVSTAPPKPEDPEDSEVSEVPETQEASETPAEPNDEATDDDVDEQGADDEVVEEPDEAGVDDEAGEKPRDEQE